MSVSFVMVFGLLFAAFSGLMITLAAIERTLRAQATCVHLNAKLNAEIGIALRDLLRLNPRARKLRAARAHADRALRLALATNLPLVIASAQAAVNAVRALQLALDVEQRALRAGAEATRLRYRRDLGLAARRIGAAGERMSFGVKRALAVEARPRGELAPEYRPVANFARAQRIRMSFRIDLVPEWARHASFQAIEHTTACIVTLEKERTRWRPKIVAASAPSNLRSALWH